MVNQKFFGIILLLFSLIGLAGFAMTTGNVSSAGTPEADEQIAGPSVPQIIEPQVLTEYQVTGSKYSANISTCTNVSDFEQVIDLKISNLDENNISVYIDYPFSRTIELSQGQIKRIDLSLPYGVTSVYLSSNDEKLSLEIPLCIGRGGSSSFSNSNESPYQPTPPIPELSTMALTGIGVFGLIFIISRSKK